MAGEITEPKHNTRSRTNSKAEVTEKPIVLCGTCDAECIESPSTYAERSMECECCIKWFHVTCVKMEKKKYDAISTLDLHWYCPSCDGAASKLYKHCVTLEAEQALLKTDVENLKLKVDTVSTEMDNKVTEKVAEQFRAADTKIEEMLKEADAKIAAKLEQADAQIAEKLRQFPPLPNPEGAPLQPAGPESPVTKVKLSAYVSEAMIEQEDIQSRKLQLMIHNLVEADESEEDAQQIQALIGKLNIGEEVQLTDIRRMGNADPAKSRLTRIAVQSLSVKRKILANAKRLRELQDTDKFARVYIRPDLTVKQQKESKNLYDTLQQKRREDPHTYYKIQKGKIITVPGVPPARPHREPAIVTELPEPAPVTEVTD